MRDESPRFITVDDLRDGRLIRGKRDERDVRKLKLLNRAVGVVVVPSLAQRAEGDGHLVEVATAKRGDRFAHARILDIEIRADAQADRVRLQTQCAGGRSCERHAGVIDEQTHVVFACCPVCSAASDSLGPPKWRAAEHAVLQVVDERVTGDADRLGGCRRAHDGTIALSCLATLRHFRHRAHHIRRAH